MVPTYVIILCVDILSKRVFCVIGVQRATDVPRTMDGREAQI